MITNQNTDQIPHDWEDAPPCPACGSVYVECVGLYQFVTENGGSAMLVCPDGHSAIVMWLRDSDGRQASLFAV